MRTQTFHPGRDLETLLEERDSLPLDFAKFLAADIVSPSFCLFLVFGDADYPLGHWTLWIERMRHHSPGPQASQSLKAE